MKKAFIASLILLFATVICFGQTKSKKPGRSIKREPVSKPKPPEVVQPVKKTPWEELSGWKATAKNKVEMLPKDSLRAVATLQQLKLNTSSMVGTVVSYTGGILIDDGWIRILGSGCSRIDRSLSEWNRDKLSVIEKDQSSYLLVADDVLGGFYGIKANSTDPDQEYVYYYGPNSLAWSQTGQTYPNFIAYCFSGKISDFYSDFYWRGWQDDVRKMSCNEVVSCFPLLWTKQGKELKTNRKIVSVQKQWELYHNLKSKFKQNTSTAQPAGKTTPTQTTPAKTSKGEVVEMNNKK